MTANPAQILADLVGFPSVARRPNRPIVDYVVGRLAGLGVEPVRIPGPEGDRENVFATIGPKDVPGLVLSGHLDVVPAEEPGWTGDPFRLRRDGERLTGRGAVDMKGFVACVLSAVPAFVARPLARPIHLAFSYDEEVGCVGVRHLLRALPDLCALPAGCFVGEPSGLHPVLRHKGKAGLRLTVTGRGGHSSRPDQAENAVHAAGELIVATRRLAEALGAGPPFDPVFSPPHSTVQVGVVHGGSALNIVPESCTLDIDARAIPGVDPVGVLAPILEEAERLEAEMAAQNRPLRIESEIVAGYPALKLDEGSPFVLLAEGISGREALGAVSYGSEAGLYQAAGVPTVVCGPGDIARAHKPDEFILESELDACSAMLARLAEEQRA